MRRLFAVALAGLSLAACSGEHGERAQQLLTRAQAAHARLHSAEFEGRLTFVMDGRRFSLVMNGGGHLKGRRAGDQLLTMRTEGVPSAGAFTMQLAVRSGHVSMSLNGHRMSLPAHGGGQLGQYNWSSAIVDLARYVKDVRVREGRVVNGERGATIAGVIETEKLLAAMAQLSAFGKAANLGDLGGEIGDIHAAVFVGSRTGLIRSAAVAVSLESGGKKAELDVSYRLVSTNRGVAGL